MTNRSSLLCGAALGVLLAGGIGATAEAKAKHHHPMAGASNNSSEISTLSAAVSDLEQRLNDETAARQATEARAAAAEAKADAAEADAQAARGALQEQIQTIPGAVQTAVAANKGKPGWWDSTKIGGTVFVDFSDISQSPRPNKINGVGADIKRAYLSIDHTFNSVYSANLTLDFAPNGIILGAGPTYGTGTLQGSEAIKYAYVQANYNPLLVIQVGAAKTPWIPFVEDIYGHRYIDKVLIDNNKFGNSSDWGLNAHGDHAFSNGVAVGYSASIEDGAGYKNSTRSIQPSYEGRVNIGYHGFVAALGGFTGTEASDVQSSTPVVPYHIASRWDALLAYSDAKIRAGVEYFNATNFKTVLGTAAVAAVAPTPVFGGTGGVCGTSAAPLCFTGGSSAKAAVPAKNDSAQGVSVFASYEFFPQWSVFGRYDWVEPSMKLAPKERYDYYDLGVNYEPVKIVDLSLVYKHEDISHAASGGYADGTTTLAPSSTGSAKGSGHLDEIGLYTQFKF